MMLAHIATIYKDLGNALHATKAQEETLATHGCGNSKVTNIVSRRGITLLIAPRVWHTNILC